MAWNETVTVHASGNSAKDEVTLLGRALFTQNAICNRVGKATVESLYLAPERCSFPSLTEACLWSTGPRYREISFTFSTVEV